MEGDQTPDTTGARLLFVVRSAPSAAYMMRIDCRHQDTGIVVASQDSAHADPAQLPAVSTTGLELANNVSVRIALDPADTPQCGALVVLPGTHRENTLAHGVNNRPPRARMVVSEFEKTNGAVVVPHRPGGALFYSPYLFHSSTPTALIDEREPDGHRWRRRILSAFYGPLNLHIPVQLDDPAVVARAGLPRTGVGEGVRWLETFPFPQPTPLTPIDRLDVADGDALATISKL
jgi:hypothetical protein